MTRTAERPLRRALTECVRLATAAPSLHNSQPWQFGIRGMEVDVYADPSRRLLVLDPSGRELLISVGAALLNLRLAIRQAGFRSDLHLFPEPEQGDLVARVTVGHPAVPSPAVTALAEAIERRHTNRHPFARVPVPDDVLDDLRKAAQREGAFLAVAHPPARKAILTMARSADRLLHHHPGYLPELARWTGNDHDGVPLWAAGPGRAAAVPLRDFAELTKLPRRNVKFEPDPSILILATNGDHWPDWVRAGQALQRVLLTATSHYLATMPISQPVEIPALRSRLLAPSSGLHVQMLLRIGYADPALATPRRPVADVLRLQATRHRGHS
ncbi:nitroreductase [Actinoplanes tereljensis]|uniref:Nitroreductase n=1 Tax=Paractinoplanes tereljensis TaxID=571912 RepID=A0A919TU87_9ACTN|nr:nitroreductase family protein [Actinoplanes tereljensis]GIF23388.1 nitroreductase [Actinoplanes tereljensis]